jgi:hypothetical protein
VTTDPDLVTAGSALEVVAEAVAELVGAYADRTGVELRGLEPLASTLPAWRSSKLSYSPSELIFCRIIEAGTLTVAGRSEP